MAHHGRSTDRTWQTNRQQSGSDQLSATSLRAQHVSAVSHKAHPDRNALVADSIMPPIFTAVHVGAGFHMDSKHVGYKRAMRKAITAALRTAEQGQSSLEAVVAAIVVLEVRSGIGN